LEALIVILTLALIGVVIFVVSAPLRAVSRPHGVESAGGRAGPGEGEGEPEEGRGEPGEGRATEEMREDRVELEVAREAKYREIRDTELDYRTGKLSKEDFAATDSALRAEAVEILDRLQRLDRAEESQRLGRDG
jgi:hypothetical protein